VKPEIQKLIWLCAGFALGAVLTASYNRVRYVPLGIAFGLLCFGCGVFLASFFDWRRRHVELEKHFIETVNKFGELQKEMEEEKKKFEEEKDDFEDEKEHWEIEHSDEPTSHTDAMDQDKPGSG
jgi:Skp family chaperone for outer membrane proteins